MDPETSVSTYNFHNPRPNKLMVNLGCTTLEIDLRSPMGNITIAHHGTPITISVDGERRIHISGPNITVGFVILLDTVHASILDNEETNAILRSAELAMTNIDTMFGPDRLYGFTMRRSPLGTDFDALRDKPRFDADGSFGIHNILRGLENSSPEDYRHFRHHRS